MSEQAHSPAPFSLIEATAAHGYLILDALGDSIGALAWSTGDHPPEEQRANARLFMAAPGVLAALKGLIAVRPSNWADDDDPDQAAAWAAADVAVALAEAVT